MYIFKEVCNLNVAQAKVGNSYIIDKINLTGALERRLEMLGMTSGVKLEVLNKKNHGAVTLKVRGTRFAVGREIAEAIEIGGNKDE